jgi:hypothetical protein
LSISVDTIELKDYYQKKGVVEVPTFHFIKENKLEHILRGKINQKSYKGNDEKQIQESLKVLKEDKEQYPYNSLATVFYKKEIIYTSNLFKINEGKILLQNTKEFQKTFQKNGEKVKEGEEENEYYDYKETKKICYLKTKTKRRETFLVEYVIFDHSDIKVEYFGNGISHKTNIGIYTKEFGKFN